MRDVNEPDLRQMEAAWHVVRRHLARTPVIAAPQLGEGISLKLETVQPTGSFKVRGGLAAVAATLAEDPSRSVIGSSAGNHGLGLAYAAAQLHADVTVIVPEHASAAKVAALKGFDVHLIEHGAGYSEAEALALEIAEREGSRYVSPYNDPDVIAGQGTIARELLEAVPNLGAVVVPVGGGGLIAGMTLGLAAAGVTVIGVESVASPSVSSALAEGHIVPVEVTATLADGLSGNLEIGAVTVDILLRHHVDVVTVQESDIRSAIAYGVGELGLVLEGAGAVGVAAVRRGLIPKLDGGKETVVLLTGRNIAPSLIDEVLSA